MKLKDENLDHKWKSTGDVKQCSKNTAKKKKPKKELDKLRKNIALDEYSSSSGYGGWGHDD